MANKQKIDEREKALQAKQSEQTVQRVGLVIVVLVVIGLVFVFIRNRPTPPAERVTITQYAAPPEMTIDPSAKYFATFKMQNGGEYVAELFADKTPVTRLAMGWAIRAIPSRTNSATISSSTKRDCSPWRILVRTRMAVSSLLRLVPPNG